MNMYAFSLKRIGKSFLSICCALFPCFSYPVVAIQHLFQIEHEVEKDPKHTLVLLDIDNTLIRPVHPMIGTYQGRKVLLSKYNINDERSRKQLSHLTTSLNPLIHWQCVEAEIPKVIHKLQVTGASVMAISGAGNQFIMNWPYHPSLTQPDSCKLYSKWLKINKIDFAKSCPKGSDIEQVCDYFSAKYEEGEGILFTCGQAISNIIPYFLEATETHYKKLIVVDDEKYFLEQFEYAFQGYPIQLHTYHYVAGSDHPLVFDPEIAQIQLKYYQQKSKLLSDEQARKRLQSK